MKNRELCFQFKSKVSNLSHEDEITDVLIDFVRDNKVSVGRNLHTGFCFFADIDKAIPKNYRQQFDEIIFK